VRTSLVLGADYYESLEEMDRAQAKGLPLLGIGGDCVIERAIVDKNARVGHGVRIVNAAGVREADGDGWFIRDGVVIVPKGGVVRDGTVI
jgi:glucose-1-phosphate adenylyltransferase